MIVLIWALKLYHYDDNRNEKYISLMAELSIRQRFLKIQSIYKEYSNLKTLISATEKFYKQDLERDPLLKINYTNLDRMKRRKITLEVKLNKLPILDG